MMHFKTLSKTLLLGGILVALASCGQQNQEPRQPEKTQQAAAPDQIIPLETAREHYRNYNDRRAPLIAHYEDSINRARGIKDSFPVARYVAFDYKVIKQYMAYIEQEAARVGADISGLRIYFANNPDDARFTHPRQNSLFLVPTVEAEGGQYGLYINGEKPGYLNWQLQPWQGRGMGMLPDPGKRAEAGFMSSPNSLQGEKSLILNFGGSGPPPWN